jgi:DUF438 domain-containing protein
MRKETQEHLKKAAASLRSSMGERFNSPLFNTINKLSTAISLALCLTMVIFIFISLDKLTEQNYKAIKLMDSKIREIPVHDTVKVSDCDTIYIIDGKHFKQIGE